MKFLALMAGAGVLAGAIGLWQSGQLGNTGGDAEVLSVVKTAEQYQIWSAGIKTACIIVLDKQIDGLLSVNAPGGCDQVDAVLRDAASARRLDDGTLVFADAKGITLAEFAQGDGFTYESIVPTGSMLAFAQLY